MTKLVSGGKPGTFTADPYEWDDWEKHFAWRPTTLDNGTRIWFKSYYSRWGEHKFAIQNGRRIYKEERCTILDVLAK